MDSEAERQRYIIRSRREGERLLKRADAAINYLTNPAKYIQFLYRKSRELGKSPTIEPVIYYATQFPQWISSVGLAYNARVNEHDYLIQDVQKRALYEKILSMSNMMASDYEKLVDIYNYQNTFFSNDALSFYRDTIMRSVSSYSGLVDISDDEINRTIELASREYIFGEGERDENQTAIINALKSMYTQRYSIPRIIYQTIKGSQNMPVPWLWRLQPGQRFIDRTVLLGGRSLPPLPEGIAIENKYLYEKHPEAIKDKKRYQRALRKYKQKIRENQVLFNRVERFIATCNKKLQEEERAINIKINQTLGRGLNKATMKEVEALRERLARVTNMYTRHIASAQRILEKAIGAPPKRKVITIEEVDKLLKEYNGQVYMKLQQEVRDFMNDQTIDISIPNEKLKKTALPQFRPMYKLIVNELGLDHIARINSPILGRMAIETAEEKTILADYELAAIFARPRDYWTVYLPREFTYGPKELKGMGFIFYPLKGPFERDFTGVTPENISQYISSDTKFIGGPTRVAKLTDEIYKRLNVIEEVPPEPNTPEREEYDRFKRDQLAAQRERDRVLESIKDSMLGNKPVNDSKPSVYAGLEESYSQFVRVYPAVEGKRTEEKRVIYWRNRKTGRFESIKKKMLSSEVQENVNRILRLILTQNYFNKGVGIKSGYLLKAIQAGRVNPATDIVSGESAKFDYEIDNRARPPRANEPPEDAPFTRTYANYVINGRGFVFSQAFLGLNKRHMLRFGPTDPYVDIDQMILSYWVRPAKPKNIFELSDRQKVAVASAFQDNMIKAWLESLKDLDRLNVDGLI